MKPEPSRARFVEIAGTSPILPVWCEVLCDADTPVAAFARLRGVCDAPFLLESVVGGERWARYSFVGVGYRAHVLGRWQGDGVGVEVMPGAGFSLPTGCPRRGGIELIPALLDHYRGAPMPGLPRFWGGLVGVWGHDVVRGFEHLPRSGDDASGVPALELLLSDVLIVFDNLSQRVKIVATACAETDGGAAAAYDGALERIARVRDALLDPAGPRPRSLELDDEVPVPTESTTSWTSGDFRDAVRRAKRYVAAGDVFQVVLSQRFDQPRGRLDPFDVYRVLRVTNPAPYMYLLELPAATLAGASPEVLVRVDRDTRRVTVRPIAGTRPRGSDQAHDRALEAELLSDAKERAEHLMLIDLGRNDVGRVSVAGTVVLEESFAVERYSQVMHIVSEVSGELLPGLRAFDALESTFPAGTLSGAPKLRALELIDELEPEDRGWYGGAVGYLGYDGGADFAICIRSVVSVGDTLRVQAGAGIVFDSDPETEDRECHSKARAVLRAIAVARTGAGDP